MTEILDRKAIESTDNGDRSSRVGGAVALIGAVVMLVGALLYGIAGADPWLAVSSGDVQTYLNDAAVSGPTLYAGLTAWIIGATTMAVGGSLLAGSVAGVGARAARTTFAVGAAVAITSFVVLATLVRLAEAGSVSFDLAASLAFLGTTLDDVATILIIGVSPVLVSMSAREGWMPRWLAGWGLACGVAGVAATVAIFLGQSSTLGFALVPVGIGWVIAAGIVSMRRA